MNKFKSIFAEVLSRLLDPVWEIPLSLLLAIAFAVREGLRWRFVGLLMFIDFVVPFIFFLIMLWHHQIHNWDMDKRMERLPLILFALFANLGGIWLAHELGRTQLVSILLVFYTVAVIFFVITLKWKISIHAGVNAVLFTSINILYDFKYAWLYILLYLVMWARVYQKHHTWAQVMAGALLGSGIVYLGLERLV